MEYFNGAIEVDVSNIDSLNDMSQDMANSIATGPQDAFFEALDTFNSDITYHGIEALDVTNKWNWKPGTSKKIIEFQTQRLQLNKTHGGITKQFDRTRERANYLSYIRNTASRLEDMKLELKRAGVTRDVDIPVFQQKTSDLVSNITDQCSLVKDLTEGKVIMTPYISTNFASRLTPFYLDVKLTGLTMSIYNGNKEIQRIPLKDIHLVFKYSFRHYINGFATQWNNKGCYYDLNQTMYRFPYIASQTRARGNYNTSSDNPWQYGNVCLDRYNEDIKKAFMNKDYIQMSMHLMNWAQYYSTNYSNPYNKLNYLHLGMPEGFSEEYKSVVSHVEEGCSTRIQKTYRWQLGNNVLEYSKQVTTPCMEISCQLRLSCSHFKKHSQIATDIEELSDKYCQIESLIGIVIESLLNTDSWTYVDWSMVLENAGLGYYTFDVKAFKTIEEKNDAWLDYLIPELTMYWLDGKTGDFLDIIMFYDVSSSSASTSYFDCGYPKEEITEAEAEKDINDEEMRKMMLEWATNPEGSR